MADFVAVLRRAVDNLETNTAETRKTLYEKARTALLGQLRTLDPPLSPEELDAQTEALDAAIAEIEQEYSEPAKVSATKTAPPPGPVPWAPAQTQPKSPAAPAPPASQDKPDNAAAPADPHQSFRSAVAETSRLGAAASTAAHSARDALGQIDGGPDGGKKDVAVEETGDAAASTTSTRNGSQPSAESVDAPPQQEESPPKNAAPVYRQEYEDTSPEGRGAGIAVWIILALVVAGIAGVGWWQREALSGMVAALMSDSTETADTQGGGKIDDRVPTPGSEQQAGGETPPQASGEDAPPAAGETGEQPATEGGERVAQAILVEETDAGSGAANTLGGSADWTLAEEPAPNGGTEKVIRATVRIPDKNLSLALAIRRNADPELPASHTVEILFDLPANFENGGIQTVPGIIMKATPQSSGQPLVGAVVPVTESFFLVGLSESEFDRARNLDEMKRRDFIDIPLAYKDGSRAVLSIAKGESGDKVFEDAFVAWGQ